MKLTKPKKPRMKVVTNSDYRIGEPHENSFKNRIKKDILSKQIFVKDKDGNLLFKGVPTSELIKLLK